MKPALKMEVRRRVQEHTGTKDPHKQMAHFEKDEKLEGTLAKEADKMEKLVRRLRK